MRPDGVIFDLDGTLVDSLGEIAWAANRARSEIGLGPLASNAYRPWIGLGLRHLVASMLGDAMDPRVDDLVLRVRRVYEAHAGERAEVYPGLEAVLHRLSDAGIPLAVLTNKPHVPAQRLIAHRFRPGLFGCVIGQRDEVPPKPDPAGAFEILGALGGEASRWWVVGDMTIDIETSQRAGMRSLGVIWGFGAEGETDAVLLRAGADGVIQRPDELLSVFGISCDASAREARHST